ncbi:molybdopterin molybdotransferase MoeA [Actinoplanes sp. KI2]|uniref:molybdopterin molybdotransferase MoeA n=1 Tax=Actinoplanes sp. KI2 TaxID=2983315 RepID=UPI0021D5CCEE|nr:molybdopterin molybdotransferase MoeA [Actinoplanes sp. KI2]MCU7729088.1 molybdopterin molybdotransferase MoeA [Actinoplanes sp. KI2]
MTLAAQEHPTSTSLDWAAARLLAYTLATPGPAEVVPLAEAAGRTLAAPLAAVVPLPGFDNAAMDGYAVRGPAPWRVAGRILAGHAVLPEPLADGAAVEIATGAPVPPGTDRVVPYEDAGRDGDRVWGADGPRRHIRWQGEYARPGQQLLPAGAIVTPPVLGLAASVGLDAVAACPRPRVRLLVSGSELVVSGPPPWGRVRDAIGPMLVPLLTSWGADLPATRMVDDDADEFADAVAACAGDAELTVVCGASSVGPADGLHRALDRLGAVVHVDGVACRPGHPQVLARHGEGWIVGLPGNPYAALVAAFTLVEPLLAGLAGRAPATPVRAPLVEPVPPDARRTRILPVRRAGDGFRPVGGGQPGYLGGAAGADGFAVLPPGPVAGPVEILRLPWPTATADPWQ